jgi:hypothetical protein
VGVRQRRGRTRLREEPLTPPGIAGELLRKELERHGTLQAGVLREIYLSHAPGAAAPDHPIRPNTLGDHDFTLAEFKERIKLKDD